MCLLLLQNFIHFLLELQLINQLHFITTSDLAGHEVFTLYVNQTPCIKTPMLQFFSILIFICKYCLYTAFPVMMSRHECLFIMPFQLSYFSCISGETDSLVNFTQYLQYIKISNKFFFLVCLFPLSGQLITTGRSSRLPVFSLISVECYCRLSFDLQLYKY